MRNIKYILINETPSENRARRPNARRDRNLGYHYIVTSECVVRNPIDIRQVGTFMPAPVCGQDDLNHCSIGILYQGELNPEFWNLKQREALFGLLVDLRSQFPDAKILGVSEYDRHQIKVNDAMNALRFELSNEP
ncbi:MAG: N-acetylmuramoyl-L-alanine amidase [Bacteroidales bacterium]|nr:N-acetylmuramoyl-L-alanine amidase [Bacteroidales bacterium]